MTSSWLVFGLACAFAGAGCGGVVDHPEAVGGDEAGGTGAPAGSSGSGGSGGSAGACSIAPWSHGFDDPFDHEYGTSVAVGASCEVVVTGNFGGTIDFGGGPLTGDGDDLFLAKFDETGEHLWSRQFGGPPQQAAGHVVVDASGDIFLAGPFGGDLDLGCGPLHSLSMSLYVARFGTDGACVWSKQFGDAETDGEAIALDGAGNVVVGGMFSGTLDFGGSPMEGGDLFVAKLDPGGAPIWSKSFGGPGSDHVSAIAVDPDGDVLLTGNFTQTIDFGGGPLSGTAEYYDAFIAKLDASGQHVWSRALSGGEQGEGMGIAATASGDLFVTGAFSGSIDLGAGPIASAGSFDGFLMALDPEGTPRWTRTFGAAGSESIYAVATDLSGGAVVTGAFSGSVDFGGGDLVSAGSEDGFVVAYDVAGAHRFSRGFGGPLGGADVGMSLAVDGSGNALVTGVYQGTADFGSGEVTSAGGFDVFLAKMPTGGAVAR